METPKATLVCWARWDSFSSRIVYVWLDTPDLDLATEGWFRVREVEIEPIEFSHADAIAHFTAYGRLKQEEIERRAAEKISDIESTIKSMSCLTYSGDSV